MTRFVAGLTILGSESGGQEGSWWETQASDPCTSSSDTRDLCIIQDGTSICCIFYMSTHYSHNSRNFLSFFFSTPAYNRVLSALKEYLITIDKCGMRERERERRVGASSIWHNPLVPAPIRDNNTSPAATTDKNPRLLLEMRQGKGGQEVSHCYLDI